jgi:hypothetical protein
MEPARPAPQYCADCGVDRCQVVGDRVLCFFCALASLVRAFGGPIDLKSQLDDYDLADALGEAIGMAVATVFGKPDTTVYADYRDGIVDEIIAYVEAERGALGADHGRDEPPYSDLRSAAAHLQVAINMLLRLL